MGISKNIPLFIYFIFFIHSAHPKKALVNSECIESERKALLEFKASLGSESSSLSSWTGSDCCSWDEIICHNLTGHVQSLQLEEFNFNSPLSPWLFNLTHLEVLSMFSSELLGSIPNMFDKLTSLTHLDLSSNSFDSAVFPDSLCSIKSLSVIQLSFNEIQGSLPSCIGNLTSLAGLYLAGNELSGEIPGGLGNLTHLTSLDLSQNRFNSSIPSSFGNLLDLEYLSLFHNQLSGAIPSTLGNLTKLIQLDASDNSLTGKLSESVLEGLKSLKVLDVSRNQYLVLSVSPHWIPSFHMLNIQMDSIFIGTQFPPWPRTQTNLLYLSMSNTDISGAIPDWCLTAFPNLTDIDLSDNLLNGSVPTFDIASLRSLQLSGNQFTGSIPQQLCDLKSLRILSLSNNQLIGTIPSCLGSLPLSILDLGNNSLSGHIPNELGSSSVLYILHLNGNNFFGELPTSFQNLTLLTTLDLGKNQLQGSLPQWIGKEWSNLQYLRLESNNFSGEISIDLCQLSSLQILNLAHNNLVGIIPPCVGNLSKMLTNEAGLIAALYGYDESLLNIIKGKEMKYTSSLKYAKFISLSSNHLHGEIPVELMNLKGLQSLNLSNNQLTGMIPQRIGNLSNLEALDLSMNGLSGTIPQSLANIDALSYLNLSFNNLAGKIPSGNHFDTLYETSIYEGNMGLCGKLLMKSCPDDDSPTSNHPNEPVSDADDEFDQPWLYSGIGLGFAVGLLGVMCVLYFNHPWRIAYFGFANNVYDKMRLTLCRSCFPSKFN